MIGGTGIFIDQTNMEQNMLDFLSNSSVSFLNSGSNGMAFKATITPTSGYVSKYKNVDYAGYNTPVTNMLIKVGVVSYKSNIPDHISRELIYPTEESEFIKEVNIQTDIFLKTMNYLQPLCPAIVYSNTFDDPTLLQLLISKLDVPNDKLNSILQFATKYTIIAMELLSGYTTLYSLRKKTDYSVYQSMVIYILIELALKTGYSQADFHEGNIMINPGDDHYFTGIQGSIMIIDFGLSRKIPPDVLEQIKSTYQDKSIHQRYNVIIRMLCEVPRSDGLELPYYNVYDTVCKYNCLDSQIDRLFSAKKTMVDEIVEQFNKDAIAENRPMLPLSNSVKNQMFPGMVDEITIDKEIVRLDLTGKNMKNVKILVDWIIDVFEHEYNRTLLRELSDAEKVKMCINSCYNCVYLLYRQVNVIKNFQMQALTGMYCAGLDETYNAKIKNRPTIYHEYQRLCDSAYSYQTIETECIKTKEILSHIHIVNIADFMPESKIAKFYYLPKTIKKDILTNELAYNDPKLAVYTMLRKPPREEEEDEKEKEEYQFPFDSQDALGGNALKGTRKKRKSKKKRRESKKRESKRKYNKSKKQVKRKT